MNNWLTPEEGDTLLLLARETIEARVTDAPLPELPAHQITQGLQTPLGAFVTLKIRTELRGCVGEMNWERPVYRNVIRAAIGSALHDPRFEPLAEEELGRIKIETTILGALQPIPSAEQFDPKLHGIQFELGGRRAVFLPQVAQETGWGRELLLENLCLKAGLVRDAWKHPQAVLKIFLTQKFSESVS
jgi:AmmeMemoRadiSam system protein A